ncbi:MAG: hypothetical protein KatS3mg109_0994 [Pirellulaceae bacterium]|nr:MAG: hypothetical protein KatS3mg109_0994 [Pirellulaceae bacterium]
MKENVVTSNDTPRMLPVTNRAGPQTWAAARKAELAEQSLPFSELFCQLCRPPSETPNVGDSPAAPQSEPKRDSEQQPDEPAASQPPADSPVPAATTFVQPQKQPDGSKPEEQHEQALEPVTDQPASSPHKKTANRAEEHLPENPRTAGEGPADLADGIIQQQPVDGTPGDLHTQEHPNSQSPVKVLPPADTTAAPETTRPQTEPTTTAAGSSDPDILPPEKDATPDRHSVTSKPHNTADSLKDGLTQASQRSEPVVSEVSGRPRPQNIQESPDEPRAPRSTRRQNSDRSPSADPRGATGPPSQPTAPSFLSSQPSPSIQDGAATSSNPASHASRDSGDVAAAIQQPGANAPPAGARVPEQFLVRVARPAGHEARPAPVDRVHLVHRVSRALELARQRDGEVRLRLSPPELGSVRLELRVRDGALVARLETETQEAKHVLLDNLPALRDRLHEQGIRVERFDVDVADRRDQATADTGQRHTRHDPPWNDSHPVERPARNSEHPPQIPVPASPMTGSINVVI